jgi:small subunit ribosomal protein S4
VQLNGRRCDIPSAQVRPNDRISIGPRDKVRKFVKDSVEQRSSYPLPGWLERDGIALEGRVTVSPMRSDVAFDVREQLVVELMSK